MQACVTPQYSKTGPESVTFFTITWFSKKLDFKAQQTRCLSMLKTPRHFVLPISSVANIRERYNANVFLCIF